MSSVKSTSNIPSPCYVLDEQKLIQNLELINRVKIEAEVDIILAFKGFAMWSAFPTILKYIDRATASSLNEVQLCREKMKVEPHVYCVAYEPTSFEQIVGDSSHITFNSINQYDRFIDRVPANTSVGLRVNPGWSDVAKDLYNAASPNSRLGIESLDDLPPRVEGLHFHVLCESDSHSLGSVLDHFTKRFGHLLPKVKWVNMGGGHIITRGGYDVDHLIEMLRDFKNGHGVDIILEPGSAFVWQAGTLETTVLDIVESNEVKTAIIDASFTCHMPDCLEMPYRPEVQGAFSSQKENYVGYRLGGVSCLAGDYIDEYWFEEPLSVGDRIIFKDMMHYTMVKTTMFNGIKHPSIGVKKTSGKFELIKEFSYEDYRDRLS